jgi:peptide chain release factor 1
MNKKDLKIEYMRGQGPGGQHKNKTCSMVRITHLPTGISATVDGRDQHKNKRKAMKELKSRLEQLKQDALAEDKKAKRDKKIQERDIIRTYDFSRGLVTDHRTKKSGTIKQILRKGKLDLLR